MASFLFRGMSVHHRESGLIQETVKIEKKLL